MTVVYSGFKSVCRGQCFCSVPQCSDTVMQRTRWRQKHPQKSQEAKVAAAEAWQSINREDSLCQQMSVSCQSPSSDVNTNALKLKLRARTLSCISTVFIAKLMQESSQTALFTSVHFLYTFYISNTERLCLTLEPCLANTSHSPVVNVISSLIAHLKSPGKKIDRRNHHAP